MPRSILGSIYQAVRLIRFKWTECNLSRTGGMMEYPHIVSWNLPSLWRLYDCQLGVDVFIFYTAVKWERRGWSFQMRKEFWTVKPYMCSEPFQVIISTCWHRPLGRCCRCWYLLKSLTPWFIPKKIDMGTCDHLWKLYRHMWSPDEIDCSMSSGAEFWDRLISRWRKIVNMIHDDPWRKLLRPLSVIVYHANIQQTKEPPERGLKKGCWDKTQPARYFLATHPTQALLLAKMV